MQELRWISISSATRIAGIIALIIGIPLGIVGFAIGTPMFGITRGFELLILGIIGLPLGVIFVINTGIALYDVAARILGGVHLDIEKGIVNKVDLTSFLRIALPTNLLYIGVCFAILFYFSTNPNLGSLYSAFYPIVVAIVIGSLNGIVDPLAYNLFSKLVGGIKLGLKSGTLTYIDRKSGAKICSMILGFNYAFYVLIITLVATLGIKVPSIYNSASSVPSYVWFFVYFAGYLIAGLVGGAIIITIYNAVTKRVDGIKLYLRRRLPA